MKDQMTFEEIKQIIDLIRETEQITDFTLKCGDVEISLSRGGNSKARPGAASLADRVEPPQDTVTRTPSPKAEPIEAAVHVSAATEFVPGEDEVVIKSPMVGTFYRSPKPGDPPFVEVGQAVREDSVLCIIEVMKLMNSLEAKVRGTVTRILVEDAQPVEHGQPLIVIEVDGN